MKRVSYLAWISLVVLLFVPNAAYTQQDSPVVVAARNLYGNFLLIPGERIGNVKLAELGATPANFSRHYGLTRTYGFSSITATWNWPDRGLGNGTINYDQPFLFVFCNTGEGKGRLFAAAAFGPGEQYRDHDILWLYHRRLVTPETPKGQSVINLPISWWLSTYGQPLTIIQDIYSQGGNRVWRFYLFTNGLFVSPSPNGPWMTYLGVYDVDICRGGTPKKGYYIPFLGRLKEPAALTISKTGNVQKSEIGPPVESRSSQLPRFKLTEPIYVSVELAFQPATVERDVTIAKRFIFPSGASGTGFPGVLEVTIKPGESKLKRVFLLGTQFQREVCTKDTKPCILTIAIGETEIVRTEFEVVE